MDVISRLIAEHQASTMNARREALNDAANYLRRRARHVEGKQDVSLLLSSAADLEDHVQAFTSAFRSE